MFAASRNITLSMTSSMVKEHEKSHRRRRSSSLSSGSRTPKTRNARGRSISPVSFDSIWSDLVADAKLFPSERQDTKIANDAENQVARQFFEEGRAYANTGQYGQAIDLFTQALTVQKTDLDNENSPCIARTLVERGKSSAAMGQLYDAVLDLEKALLIERRVSDDESESLDVASSFLRVGQIQHKRGNFVEAVHCFQCALAIHQRVLGNYDVRVARIICILAVSHHQRRRYAEAIEYYTQGLAALKAMHMAKDSPEFIFLRRCVADKNLYFDRVEKFWEDTNAV